MLSITTLIIAAVFFIILLLVSIFVPNPITWLMTLALGAVFYFILWPKYQGQQQAVRQGVEIQAAVQVPLLHLVDATAEAVKAQGLATVGLLGTQFTMSDGFYSRRMQRQGVRTLVPSETQRAEIHRVIFNELCLGRFETEAKAYYLDVIEDLRTQGAEGVILGCTEIGLLLKPEDCALPLFDSAEIHAHSAVDFVLQC